MQHWRYRAGDGHVTVERFCLVGQYIGPGEGEALIERHVGRGHSHSRREFAGRWHWFIWIAHVFVETGVLGGAPCEFPVGIEIERAGDAVLGRPSSEKMPLIAA